MEICRNKVLYNKYPPEFNRSSQPFTFSCKSKIPTSLVSPFFHRDDYLVAHPRRVITIVVVVGVPHNFDVARSFVFRHSETSAENHALISGARNHTRASCWRKFSASLDGRDNSTVRAKRRANNWKQKKKKKIISKKRSLHWEECESKKRLVIDRPLLRII